MRLQNLISISTALFLGLMSFVFTGIEAAPVKMQAAQTKPAKATVLQTAQVNIIKAVLKPSRTKGKLSLKVILHNSSATRTSAFTVKALHQGRVVGKANLSRLNARARITRTLRNLPQRKGQRCVSVRLTKPRGSKLKLGKPLRACLKSSMAIRKGIDTLPTRKVDSRTTTRGKLGNTSRIGIKGSVRIRNAVFAHVGTFTLDNGQGQAPQAVEITVNPGQTVTANWSFPSGLAGDPNRVILRVHPGAFQNIPNECQTGGGDTINSGAINGLTGSYTINLASLTVGQTYKVKACLENSGTGNTGGESHVVTLKYENPTPKPDLIVTNIKVDNLNNNAGRIVFTVKNLGPGTKPRVCTLFKPAGCVGRNMNYHVTLIDSSGGSTVISGTSLIDMVELRPGGEFLQPLSQTVTGKKFHIVACINKNRMQAETRYTNNCKRAIIYPKVTVTLTSIKVHRRGDGDNLTKGDWIVYLFTPYSERPFRFKRWPTSGTRNVDSNSTITPNLTLAQNLTSSHSLRFSVGVIDCDHRGIGGFLGDILPPNSFDASGLPPLPAYKCSGEEVIEDNGKEEYAIEHFSIPTYQWQHQSGPRTVSRRIRQQGLDFTVNLRIEVK